MINNLDPSIAVEHDKFPSACIKLAEFFEEWLSLDNVHKNLNMVLKNSLDEQFGGVIDRSLLSNLIQPPRSPGKKSPKKRSHDESSNFNNNSHVHRTLSHTAKPNPLNATLLSSSSSPSSLPNNIHLNDVRNDVNKTNDIYIDHNLNKHPTISNNDNSKNNGNISEITQNVASKRRSNYDSIPIFYRPGDINGNRMRVLRKENDLLSSRMTEIESFFKPFAAGYPIQTFVHVTKRLCNFPSYFNLQLCKRIIYINSEKSPKNINNSNTNNHNHNNNNDNNNDNDNDLNYPEELPLNTKITLKQFLIYWKREYENYDHVERIFRLMKKPNVSYITKDDLRPILEELLHHHPGLEFLEQHVEFQRKYALTVITRMFYTVNTSRTGKITLRELKQSNLVKELMHVDEQSDINKVVNYFSYEHFYVLYCTFFELDRDQDAKLGIDDLLKYAEHSLSDPIVERIFQVGSRPFTDGREGGFRDDGLSFSDFIYFVISEEDKTTIQSLTYWFKCVDLDGDGKLSPEEMNYFFRIQLHRITSYGQEAVKFEDVLCQMIDMIDPVDPLAITITDLTRSDVIEVSGLLFDVLFNLNKFMRFEMRDPFQDKVRREDPFTTDWDRFCHAEYRRLSADEDKSTNNMDIDDGHRADHDVASWNLDEDSPDEYSAY